MPSSLTPSLVRVLIVDEHLEMLIRLKTLLGGDPRICVVGEAATGGECLQRAIELSPDVVVLDLRLGDLAGIEVCRQLKALPQRPCVLVLTSSADDSWVLSIIQAGADGYLPKDLGEIDLAVGILHIARRSSFLDPMLARILMSASRMDSGGEQGAKRVGRLSPEEERILRLFAAGRTSKEVAALTNVSVFTVCSLKVSMFGKMGF
jgi:DNA-binding NarL/FixJ family response regulator